MPSKPFLGRKRLSILLCAMAGGLVLSGCATVPAPLTINVPPSLRADCQAPDPDKVVTAGDLAAFSIRQEAALQVCNGARGALVAIIDSQAQIAKPVHSWWPWAKLSP